MLKGHKNVPDKILNKAYNSLLYTNKSVSEQDKIIVRQHKYIKKHGDFKIETEKTDSELICTLHINNEQYTCKIPLYYDTITSKLYPFGDIKFENVQLMAVSFQEQNYWAYESFNVSYWANPIKINEGDGFKKINDPWIKNKVRILTQFYIPRGLQHEQPDIKECVTDNNSDNEFNVVDVKNYTHCKMPNPWIKYSMGVIYEDKNVANKLFEHNDIYGSKENYSLTPPEKMP